MPSWRSSRSTSSPSEDRMVENGIRFRRIGRREGLSASILEAADACEEATKECEA